MSHYYARYFVDLFHSSRLFVVSHICSSFKQKLKKFEKHEECFSEMAHIYCHGQSIREHLHFKAFVFLVPLGPFPFDSFHFKNIFPYPVFFKTHKELTEGPKVLNGPDPLV